MNIRLRSYRHRRQATSDGWRYHHSHSNVPMHCPRLRYEFHEKFRSCIWSYCWFFFLSYRYLNISLSFFSSLIFALPCLLLNNIFACHFEHFCTVIFSFSLSYSLITFYCRTPCYITLTPYNSLTPHHTPLIFPPSHPLPYTPPLTQATLSWRSKPPNPWTNQ